MMPITPCPHCHDVQLQRTDAITVPSSWSASTVVQCPKCGFVGKLSIVLTQHSRPDLRRVKATAAA